jgi:imidazolonepropionase-like amidohydrolase
MKSKFKKIFTYSLISLLLPTSVIVFGVLLPMKNYNQKEETTANFLITNCNIVDVKSGKIIPNKQLLIWNGSIISIGTILDKIPSNIKTINANGMYLMPTLWDMHIHTLALSPQLHFPLLIAHGITGVRDMGDGDSWKSELNDTKTKDQLIWERKAINDGLLIPKIIQSTSYHLEELTNVNNLNYLKKAEMLVSKLKKRGEPFVKIQLEEADLPNYIFYELQNQAKKQGIPILGHLSPNLDINKVIDYEFKSIEHAWALIPHFVKHKKKFKKDIQQKSYELKHQDTVLTQEILTKIAKNKIYYVPTHVTSNRKEYLAFDKDYNQNPNNVYVENVQLLFWKILNHLHALGYDKATDLPILKAYYDKGLEITRLANKKGVTILAGTDALDRNVYYGISLHDELKEMVHAGLSNAEALRTATYNSAEYFNLSHDFGSIEVGMKADFMLLKKNPLANISNTKTISAIYYNQRWYNETELEDMKKFVKEQAKSFNVSCKFIWNIIKGF